jgi:hypothetical protein
MSIGCALSRLRSQPLMSPAKPLTFPIQQFKGGFYVNSSSRYDGRNAVHSGRACVHCDDCAGHYYNQEARIAQGGDRLR